jgi:hypothetical protein
VNQRLSAAGAALHSQDTWSRDRGTVTGYVQGNTVTITGPAGTSVPVTAPNGTKVGTAKGAAFGSAYGGELSAATTLGPGALTLNLKTAPYPAGQAQAGPQAAPAAKAVKSTATINAEQDPVAVPDGKQGDAITKAVNGVADKP